MSTHSTVQYNSVLYHNTVLCWLPFYAEGLNNKGGRKEMNVAIGRKKEREEMGNSEGVQQKEEKRGRMKEG